MRKNLIQQDALLKEIFLFQSESLILKNEDSFYFEAATLLEEEITTYFTSTSTFKS